MTLSQLRASLLVVGPGRDPAWDSSWRAQLVDNLAVLCGHLQQVGITTVFADGSFATDKAHPGDIDGYFLCDLAPFLQTQFQRLVAIDNVWDMRLSARDAQGKPKPLMWHKYHVELFPHYNQPFSSVNPAAMDPNGQPILFPEFFRHTRNKTPRGIVRISEETKS